jgi:hypothetical protein
MSGCSSIWLITGVRRFHPSAAGDDDLKLHTPMLLISPSFCRLIIPFQLQRSDRSPELASASGRDRHNQAGVSPGFRAMLPGAFLIVIPQLGGNE